MVTARIEAYSEAQKDTDPEEEETITKMEATHLVPALVFGGILGILLLASGASLSDALLALCVAYALVTFVEIAFELDASASREHKR